MMKTLTRRNSFIALLKKKDEDTKLKAKPKKQVITAPSENSRQGKHLVLLMLLLKIDPSEYTAELASKTREMVIAIENPDPNLEIKIDQRRPVVRTKEGHIHCCSCYCLVSIAC